jgi:hypothetical protein
MRVCDGLCRCKQEPSKDQNKRENFVSVDQYSLVVCCLEARTLGTGEIFIDPYLDALILMLLTAADISSG